MRYFQNFQRYGTIWLSYDHVIPWDRSRAQLNYGDLNSKTLVTNRATNGPDEGKSRIYHLNTSCEWYLYSKHFHFILATIISTAPTQNFKIWNSDTVWIKTQSLVPNVEQIIIKKFN